MSLCSSTSNRCLELEPTRMFNTGALNLNQLPLTPHLVDVTSKLWSCVSSSNPFMLFKFPMKMPLTSPLLVLFLGESGTRNDNNTRKGVLEVWHSVTKQLTRNSGSFVSRHLYALQLPQPHAFSFSSDFKCSTPDLAALWNQSIQKPLVLEALLTAWTPVYSSTYHSEMPVTSNIQWPQIFNI